MNQKINSVTTTRLFMLILLGSSFLAPRANAKLTEPYTAAACKALCAEVTLGPGFQLKTCEAACDAAASLPQKIVCIKPIPNYSNFRAKCDFQCACIFEGNPKMIPKCKAGCHAIDIKVCGV